MTLIWELSFIRAAQGEQKVMLTRAYENGDHKSKVELTDEQIIFLNYVSLFPAKDIVRIKLGLSGHFMYTYYYFDKSFFDRGFLGVFGVSEYNTSEVYDWNEIEFISKYVFSEYMNRLEDGRILSPEGSQLYLDWLDDQIQQNYQQFLISKDQHYKAKSENTKNALLATFQNIAAKSEKEAKKESGWRNNGKNQLKLREIRIEENERVLEFEKLSADDKKWLDLHRNWDFQLINQFGNPMTKVMAFKNGELREWGSEEEQNMQSLEGMTYSVLKSFVEQQKLSLRNMKWRKLEGIAYILFQTVKIGDMSYLIIMNVNNFDPKTQSNIDLLKGDEEEVLLQIAKELEAKKDEFFNEKGEFKNKKIDHEIESLFFRNCKAKFR
jgi:hypothetical protein